MSKRITYLFGAGAVIDWGAPFTSDLTELVCKSGFFCKNEEKRVTQKIFEMLSVVIPVEEINFETILSAVEELSIYFSAKEYHKPNSIIFPFLLEKEDLDLIFNYKVDGDWGHGKKLNIPNTDLYGNSDALHGQSEKQFYLELLYKDLLTVINNRISKYAYHTSTYSVIENKKNHVLNNFFVNWIKSHENSIHRLYTLNYDRLFSVLLKNSGINTFEGADVPSALTFKEEHGFDLKKITLDFDTHCYYNLHGSVFWKVYARNIRMLASVDIRLNDVPNFAVNELEVPVLEMEKGKKIVVSNIISGYQKTQKLSIAPFRQMQSAFDRDCLFSDKIYIIGYSFGDKHINEMLRVAINENPKMEIVIIDPSYKDELKKKAILEIWSDQILTPQVKNIKFGNFLKEI